MVLGAIASVVFGFVLGMLWYSPFGLGKLWMRATFPGKTPKQIEDGAHPAALPLTFCAQACLVAAIHYLVGPYLGVTSVPAALKVGLALSVVETLVSVPDILFVRRPIVSFLIDHAYNATFLTATCLCLVFF